jgi:hypothetical protein
MTDRLIAIGDDLERAARADLAATRRGRTRRRRVLGGAAAIAILAPSAALAGGLLSTSDVARSLPAGTQFLVGTKPACEVVDEGVEYHCTIDRAPQSGISDLKGTVEPTVDASRHTNGGCRSLRTDGTEWQCYIGQRAVDEQIIGPGLLGAYSPGPGAG